MRERDLGSTRLVSETSGVGLYPYIKEVGGGNQEVILGFVPEIQFPDVERVQYHAIAWRGRFWYREGSNRLSWGLVVSSPSED
ncbi:hypothetical protein GCM10009066_00140 [Halarchaeum salinum]|uniref:Uncharacterized protein n=1 Tax=Halarchaeum salinum TaxID=489912 RepID=A0AAV3S1M3_9EURY